jgi:hypothetical protein
MKVRTSLIGLLVVCGIGVCSIGTAAAQPAGPPAGYKINPEFTKTSPDGAITIEQYENKDAPRELRNSYLITLRIGELKCVVPAICIMEIPLSRLTYFYFPRI